MFAYNLLTWFGIDLGNLINASEKYVSQTYSQTLCKLFTYALANFLFNIYLFYLYKRMSKSIEYSIENIVWNTE